MSDNVQQSPTTATTRCDICGDTIHDHDHAVHFRVTGDNPQSVCEICVEEIWDSVKGDSVAAIPSKS